MANTIPSPNMALPIPVVGVDPGPDYATNLNNSLSIIDGHNHSAGSGVPITPSGLNISTDLPFNGNNLTLARSLRMSAQTSPLSEATDLGCLYVSGVDLYYNDISGNQIQITQSGGIAGSPGSIANLTSPASASYVSANSTFVWQSAANTSALLDCGSILMRNATASSNAMTINPPSAMGSSFGITFPVLPPTQNIMTMDASGNIGASYVLDNATLQVSSNTLSVRQISTPQMVDGSVTLPKLAPANFVVSASCGTFATTSTVLVPVTNLSVTIVSSGRPIFVGLRGTVTISAIVSVGSGVNPNSQIAIVLGSGVIATYQLASGTSGTSVIIPCSAISTFDIQPAGTLIYTIQVLSSSSSTTTEVINAELFAYEF